MDKKKKFIKLINVFFNRKVKKDENIFFECDSLKLIKLILELEKITKIPKEIKFLNKVDLFNVLFK